MNEFKSYSFAERQEDLCGPADERLNAQQPQAGSSQPFPCNNQDDDTMTRAAVITVEDYSQDVGQSLPELARELVSAQGSQQGEISRREKMLASVKEELEKEKEEAAAIERKVCRAAREICLMQEKAAQASHNRVRLEREVADRVATVESLRLEAKCTRDKLEQLKSQRQRYGDKMATHVKATKSVEQSGVLQQELEALERKISQLKEKRSRHMDRAASLEKQDLLQEKLATVDTTRALLAEENMQLEKQVELGKEQIMQLKTDVELAKKKQKAQVTRMHHQLQEAMARRRQWAEKAKQLGRSVAQLRQKIEE